MGKKLAIKGHSTRGNEVIEILEMIGGTNPFSINDGKVIGNKETNCYYISEDIAKGYISWDYIGPEEIDKYEIFTLEEFLKKYPYKVGDKVIDCYGELLTIKSMGWSEDCETMVYDFEDSIIVLAMEDMLKWNMVPTNKETNEMKLSDSKCERTHEDVIFDSIIWHLRNSVNNGEQNLSGGECEDYFREIVKKNNENKMKNVFAELFEHIKTTPKEELEKEFKEIEEWSNVGPTVKEFMDFCNKVNKKPEYPKTYEECCEVLGIGSYFEPEIRNATTEECHKFTKLIKLKRCRDAYWKIAGEEMGLDKPWEPDYTDLNNITYYGLYNELRYSIINPAQFIFPTIEMRDAFYENFKDLIESCKELL